MFLKIIYDWPKSLFDWDILFLIPLPWWGPVIAPVSIALLMIAWGTLVTLDAVRDPPPQVRRSGGASALSVPRWRSTCSWPIRFTRSARE